MEKVIYLLWRPQNLDTEQWGTKLRKDLPATLKTLGVHTARLNIDDANVAPATALRQKRMDEQPTGFLQVWIDSANDPLRAPLDAAIARLGKGGEIVLAGFYGERVSFGFVPAFMREISVSIAAEFRPADIQAVLSLIEAQRLSLAGLITHHAAPQQARTAYRTAFTDRSCLKMVIDWRNAA